MISVHPAQRLTISLLPAVSPILVIYDSLSSSSMVPNWIGYMQHVKSGSSHALAPSPLMATDAAYTT